EAAWQGPAAQAASTALQCPSAAMTLQCRACSARTWRAPAGSWALDSTATSPYYSNHFSGYYERRGRMTAVDLLQRIGLNKYEAEAYYALLVAGPLTGYELGKRSTVPL